MERPGRFHRIGLERPVRGALAIVSLLVPSAAKAAEVSGFNTLPPCRLIDTRGATGVPLGGPALGAGSRTFDVRGRCGLPDTASAVSYNVTITAPTAAGNLRISPGGIAAPLASVINYAAGQTRANNGIVPLGADGSIAVQCDQASGLVNMILDVNGYFTSTDSVPTKAGSYVAVRPAPEVEITFDNVITPGVTTAQVVEFADNRSGAIDQDLRDFFPVGSPLRTLLPSVVVPSYVQGLGKGGPGGPPTFVLSIVDTTAVFARTAEFHGLEDFRIGWHPPCVNTADPTQEPRTFYAREAPKGEPALVEETAFGGPVFVDISSACGSNKGSGWNFSLYLTARDSRTPLQIASFMLQRIQDALLALGSSITNPTVASQLSAQVAAAQTNLGTAPAASITSLNTFVGIVDGNPSAFNNVARNVSGELVGRALSARYISQKLIPTGVLTEFSVPTAASSPWGITSGPDGSLWFAENTGNKIGRITPAGVIAEFPVPTAGSLPSWLTAGPDGNVWFVEPAGHKVSRITPAGVITEFALPTAGFNPYGLTAGPDGNIWVTSLHRNRIARVTPSGVITEFPLPLPDRRPFGIVAGPDGNLWFAEQSANAIGRMTPAGVLTEFPVPTPNSQPAQMAVGSDGNIWFTAWGASKVGRVTPAGVITEFVPPPGNDTSTIAAGPDGNLWVTGFNANKILRLSTSGVWTSFDVPTAASRPFGITRGPDGNLWFAEQAGNKIGRISP